MSSRSWHLGRVLGLEENPTPSSQTACHTSKLHVGGLTGLIPVISPLFQIPGNHPWWSFSIKQENNGPQNVLILIPGTCEHVTSNSKGTWPMWPRQGPGGGEAILCHQCGPSVILRGLGRESREQQRQRQRSEDALLQALRMGKGHKPRGLGSMQSLEKAREQILPQTSHRNTARPIH